MENFNHYFLKYFFCCSIFFGTPKMCLVAVLTLSHWSLKPCSFSDYILPCLFLRFGNFYWSVFRFTVFLSSIIMCWVAASKKLCPFLEFVNITLCGKRCDLIKDCERWSLSLGYLTSSKSSDNCPYKCEAEGDLI